jgi:Flp pilus assembly protein TadD
LLKAGQFDAALEVFLALRAEPALEWRALVYAAYCHLNAGRWRRARPLFEQALPLIPVDAAATRTAVLELLAAHVT